MTLVVAQMAQKGRKLSGAESVLETILHTPNKESGMVKRYTLLSISLRQLAEDLVLVGYHLC